MLISRKIWLLVGIAMITSASVSSFGLYGLKSVNSNMVEIADKSVPALLSVSDMRTAYLALIPQLYNRATTTDAEKGKALFAKSVVKHGVPWPRPAIERVSDQGLIRGPSSETIPGSLRGSEWRRH